MRGVLLAVYTEQRAGASEQSEWLKEGLMSARRRVAVTGAGHNALVCAAYLAREGYDVAVFERRSRVGGAVNTEEIWRIPYE